MSRPLLRFLQRTSYGSEAVIFNNIRRQLIARAYSKRANTVQDEKPKEQLVDFVGVQIQPQDTASRIVDLLNTRMVKTIGTAGAKIELSGIAEKPKVFRVSTEDIELRKKEKIGQFFVGAVGGNVSVMYGGKGAATSKNVSPADLLKYRLPIKQGQAGILEVVKHVPFALLAENPKTSFVMTMGGHLTEVLSYVENLKKFQLFVLSELSENTAKILSIDLQRRIFTDKNLEMFYEEATSVVYKPTTSNRSSATLMNFEERSKSTTNMHYYSAERVLMVYTTNKEAGVTLNFCGIGENPDQRKDCEVNLSFKPNSLSVLTFPAYTHHKFKGDFVCLISHPREGQNFIKSLQSRKLSKNFLESATVFSKKDSDPEKWNLELETRSEFAKTISSRTSEQEAKFKIDLEKDITTAKPEESPSVKLKNSTAVKLMQNNLIKSQSK
jgi:hypothetical protein